MNYEEDIGSIPQMTYETAKDSIEKESVKEGAKHGILEKVLSCRSCGSTLRPALGGLEEKDLILHEAVSVCPTCLYKGIASTEFLISHRYIGVSCIPSSKYQRMTSARFGTGAAFPRLIARMTRGIKIRPGELNRLEKVLRVFLKRAQYVTAADISYLYKLCKETEVPQSRKTEMERLVDLYAAYMAEERLRLVLKQYFPEGTTATVNDLKALLGDEATKILDEVTFK